MTNHVVRLYTLALTLLIFVVTWAGVAARPFGSPRTDPRLAALAAREQRVRNESAAVARIVRHRWAVYHAALKKRQGQIAASKRAQLSSAPAPSPSVRVVNLPPLTVTRTS
jgi:hypothetical protein